MGKVRREQDEALALPFHTQGLVDADPGAGSWRVPLQAPQARLERPGLVHTSHGLQHVLRLVVPDLRLLVPDRGCCCRELGGPSALQPREIRPAGLGWPLAWGVEVLLLKTAMYLLNSSQQSNVGVPFFDLCAYGGYIFVHVTTQVMVGMFAGHWGYYVALAWGTLCMGVFLVKTLKRILYSQTRQGSKQHSKRQSYMLLGIAMAQLPLAYWLGKIQ